MFLSVSTATGHSLFVAGAMKVRLKPPRAPPLA